jgi:hypothetical protein
LALLGAFLRGAFGLPKADREAIQRVKDWAREALEADPDTAFAVNEIACADPACPGIETVILVMEPGVRTRACKVAKPLNEVTEQDIHDALEP